MCGNHLHVILKTTSKYIGVNWSKSNKKWMSRISINNKRIFLGYYNTEHEAHLAYQKEKNKIIKCR